MLRQLVLAFDTSAAACDIAVLGGKDVLAHRKEVMAKGQAERLLPLCAEILASVGANVTDLAAIGVGVGPGNFTGIRIAVAAARGLALGLRIPAVGVSTFDALRLGFDHPCVCTVDARRAQAYVQEYSDMSAVGEPGIRPLSTLEAFNLPIIGVGGRQSQYPLSVAIAKIATVRRIEPSERPAPMYLRPADAAPAKDAPPLILE
ncbi:MAG: tRNA (adenosine(37)-N6)-threonylcarbamoyltransferase complex dimerization subunit type 1 TsaB [Roseobacter sp.]|jgi:N6-L-threonylcarbamoyladenine synthase